MSLRPSTLFALAVESTAALPQPTNRRFDPRTWLQAFNEIERPADRDLDLLSAAVMVGQELKLLREHVAGLLPLDKGPSFVRALAIAEGNRQYQLLVQKSQARSRRLSKERKAHLTHLVEQRFASALPENENTADGFSETLVDLIPIWLFRVSESKDTSSSGKAKLPERLIECGAKLTTFFSLELLYKNLWQKCLWQDYRFSKNDGGWSANPADVDSEELWIAWWQRQSMLYAQGPVTDLVGLVSEPAGAEMSGRARYTTVIAVERKVGRKRQFSVGAPLLKSPSSIRREIQRRHLDDSYVAEFLDTVLAIAKGSTATPLDLLNVWNLLVDLAQSLAAEHETLLYNDADGVRASALVVNREELISLIQLCCSFDDIKSAAIADFLAVDPDKPGEMFPKGLWSRPLVKLNRDGRLGIVLAALMSDLPVRRIELWLERGGAEDKSTGTLRGRHFEARVRNRLSEAIAKNPLRLDARCSRSSLPRASESDEEIDALVQLGDLIIVIEAKCFLAPAEAHERYNYLEKLDKACAQAERKCDWLRENGHRVSEILDLSTQISDATKFIPLVVLNQGYGIGFRRHNCSCVDLHFLRVYLSEGVITWEGALDFKLGNAIFDKFRLYSSKEEAVEKFEATMASPPVLARFRKNVHWRNTKVPRHDNTSISFRFPYTDMDAGTLRKVTAMTAAIEDLRSQ